MTRNRAPRPRAGRASWRNNGPGGPLVSFDRFKPPLPFCNNPAMPRTWFRAVLALLLLGVLSIVALSPVAAQLERSMSWERFDASLDLLPDSTVRVVETHKLVFQGTYRRAWREISLTGLSSLTEVQVAESGQPFRPGNDEPGVFATSREGDRLRVDWWFPSTTNASRTFQISYRVIGALRVYPDGVRLSWAALQADRPGTVDEAQILIRLPAEVSADRLRAQFNYDGIVGQGQLLPGNRELRYVVSDLEPGAELDVSLEFPNGLVEARPPGWQAAYDRSEWLRWAIQPLVILMVILAVLICITIAARAWRRRVGVGGARPHRISLD